jgi:hypothetical protein
MQFETENVYSITGCLLIDVLLLSIRRVEKYVRDINAAGVSW